MDEWSSDTTLQLPEIGINQWFSYDDNDVSGPLSVEDKLEVHSKYVCLVHFRCIGHVWFVDCIVRVLLVELNFFVVT